MRIIRQHTFESPGQIWKILISDSGKFLLETRDVNSKEVFFHCYDFQSDSVIFSEMQFEEKFWVGIEAFHNQTAFFHKYPKPDIPGNKEIIALDINTGKVLWTNRELSFLFLLDNRVYGFQQGFEDRYFTSLDCLTGEVIENLGTDFHKINLLREQAEDGKKWENYRYPKKYSGSDPDQRINEVVLSHTSRPDIEGDTEYNVYEDLLFMNFHTKSENNSFNNNFMAVDLLSGKLMVREMLNLNAPTLFTDSFFIYGEFLFLLKEKNGLIIYRLEQN